MFLPQIVAEHLVSQVKAEVKIQSMCGHHPFIVNAPFYWQTHKQLYLVSQYYPGGELLDLIRQYNGPFPEPVVRIYVAEIALALGKYNWSLVKTIVAFARYK